MDVSAVPDPPGAITTSLRTKAGTRDEEHNATRTAGRDHVSILMVEDNPGDVLLIEEMLCDTIDWQFSLQHAGTLSAAIDRLEDFTPSIILLDLNLPDSSGLDGLKVLAAATGWSIPIIVLTGIDGGQMAVQAIQHDAQDYLVKTGLTRDVLHRAIRYAIERFRIASELRESEGRFRTITENASDLILIFDPGGLCTYASPSAKRLTNRSPKDMTGRHLTELFAGDNLNNIQALFDRAQANPEKLLPLPDVTVGGADGREVYCAGTIVAFLHVKGVEGIVFNMHDITERKLQENIIQRQANIDELTGLPNRNLFHDRMTKAIAQAQRHSEKLALFFVDLDGFKNINDTLGHFAGDCVLCSAASRLSESVRDTDTVARMGGDEFTVILTEVSDPLDVDHVATKLRTSLEKPFKLGNDERFISASIGIAIYPDDGDSPDELLKNADTAMYRAKRAGKRRHRFFTQEMNASALARAELELELRAALEQRSLCVHYQPIVDVNTFEIQGFEALARWPNASGEFVPPNRFIPVAEECGLINDLGAWIFKDSCRQLSRWREAGFHDLKIGINVSPRQFHDDDLHEVIATYTAEFDIPVSSIVLEITESLYLGDHHENALQILGIWRDRGMHVALDDFGTGFSSLSYMKKYPVDIIKIDRTFVQDLSERDEDAALIRAMVAMAHALDVKIVAEGVESDAQFHWLKALGCDFAQGYRFGRPATAEEATRMLEARPEFGDGHAASGRC